MIVWLSMYGYEPRNETSYVCACICVMLWCAYGHSLLGYVYQALIAVGILDNSVVCFVNFFLK